MEGVFTMDKYYIGLDIGTDSVGWAVTDENYNLVRKNSKALWGIRLFDEAQKAEERRTFRTGRRRLERRKQRMQWLKEAFADEIAKVDPAFFQRLRESSFEEADKRSDDGSMLGKYILFNDKNYTDKDLKDKFPTIYHLRKALVESDEPFDIRMVYLAIHHIMKYRGHFLYDMSIDDMDPDSGESNGGASAFEECMVKLNDAVRACREEYDISDDDSDSSADVSEYSDFCPADRTVYDKIKEALTDKKYKGKKQKQAAIEEALKPDKSDKLSTEVIKLICGMNTSIKKLYGDGVEVEKDETICLEGNFESTEQKISEAIGSDKMALILAAKGIYDWALMETMISGEKYISDAMVKKYDKHCSDLAKLKSAVKATGDHKLYYEIFRSKDPKCNNYGAYVGSGTEHRCAYEDFMKFLKNRLSPYQDDPNVGEQIRSILSEVEEKTFLPKQTSKDNGVIPHQLNGVELKKILEHASKYLPFLNEKDSSGLTKAEQIMQMFEFRVPYYVGPLNPKSSHAWVSRSDEKIYPWNFDRVVNLEESNERFIERMTAKCSYTGDDVLPKSSLLYTKYMVLNELNNLTVNGHAISVADKQKIYNEVCMSGKKTTQRKIRTCLGLSEDDMIGGIDQDLKADLAPWAYYRHILERDGGYDMVENIIRHITIFGDDKKLLKRWISKDYGNVLSDKDMAYALNFKCNSWGRLSKSLLDDAEKVYHEDPQTGECLSIIDMLWRTNDNLMELLSNKYSFSTHLNEYLAKKADGHAVTLQDYLTESYASPALKRAINQTMRIVSEIVKIMRHEPAKVFVEMARGGGVKNERTVSRKAALMKLYDNCKNDCGKLYEQLEGCDDGSLRRDKLYLYFTQLGKCMYSGEPIDLSRLDSDYDIDHIYPQSKIKDDSLSNRVLVKRELNAHKADEYPLKWEVRERMRGFWAMLRAKELISKEKYERLTRSTPLGSDELAAFVARQLVETRQSTKIIANWLEQIYSDTDVIYVKAGNVSSFRQEQRITDDGTQIQACYCKNIETKQDPLFVKCRDINDFHHARDAYLNIVVGNVYDTQFTKDPRNFFRSDRDSFNLNNLYKHNVSRGDTTAWIADGNKSIETVRNTMRKNNILVTRMSFEVGGGLFDQQLLKRKNGQAMVKSSDERMTIDKRGGYNKIAGAYFALIEHMDGKKKVRSIEPVYIMHKELYETDQKRYFKEALDIDLLRVLIPKIRKDALIELDGYKLNISSRSGDKLVTKNANRLIIDPKWNQYVKDITKYLGKCKPGLADPEITTFDGITAEQNIELYDLLVAKLASKPYCAKLNDIANKIRAGKDKYIELTIPNQCRVIQQILKRFSNSASGIDLTLIGCARQAAILSLGTNINSLRGHSLYLINQSPTGFYEEKIDLLSEDLK